MTHSQLAFPLSYRPAFGRSDFLVGACNQEAVEWIDSYPNWPQPVLIICGESGSGKSHLASIFSQTQISARALTLRRAISEAAEKIVVEDIDFLASEEALFHLYNQVVARKGALLMTARRLPVFKLKDLRSRLNAAPQVHISMPDEELLGAVLIKAFYERQLWVDPKVIEYTVLRLPRSFELVQAVIKEADLLSLEKQQKITIPLMRQVLDTVLSACRLKESQLELF